MFCDTSFIVHLLRGVPAAAQLAAELPRLVIPLIAVGELWIGVYSSRRQAAEEQKLRDLIGIASIVSPDEETAD